MDEQLVLTAQTLKLNPNVQRAEFAGVAFVVKNVPARKYLTVTAEQWNLLRNFSNPSTVPDVLRASILNRTCLPLREYYELVLKAYRAGILQTDRHGTETQVHARQWVVSLGPTLPLILTWISAVAAIAFLVAKPFPWPSLWPAGLQDIVASWVLLVAGVSLGQALAASVLRGGGGEIYDVRFLFMRPVPHLAVNLDDACMCDRLTQASVWSVRLFPVLASAAALWWLRPAWGCLHTVAVLAMLHPFDGGGVAHLLSIASRGHVLDTQKNFLFSLNRRWRVEFKFGLLRLSPAYVFARLGWGLLWTVLVLFTVLRAYNVKLRTIFGSRDYWGQVGLILAVLAAIGLTIYVVPPVVRSLIRRMVANYEKWRTQWKRWRISREAPVPEEQITRAMADSLLLRRLPPADRAEISKRAQPRCFKAWQVLQRFSEPTKEVGLILSGRVVVYRRLKSGRAERALYLREGDVFGAHELLDSQRQQAQIRTLTPTLALMMPLREFQQRVIGPLGIPQAQNLAHKAPFLRELPVCSNWHPQAVARFAQLASIVSYNANEVIVAERQDSQQFYVVYEGRVIVSRHGKTIAKLNAGAFFGEISLLQNSSAVTDVIAREPTRCLTITKSDFLRFVTHNPLVGIELEEISEKRLGRPVFPHAFGSIFEEIAVR